LIYRFKQAWGPGGTDPWLVLRRGDQLQLWTPRSTWASVEGREAPSTLVLSLNHGVAPIFGYHTVGTKLIETASWQDAASRFEVSVPAVMAFLRKEDPALAADLDDIENDIIQEDTSPTRDAVWVHFNGDDKAPAVPGAPGVTLAFGSPTNVGIVNGQGTVHEVKFAPGRKGGYVAALVTINFRTVTVVIDDETVWGSVEGDNPIDAQRAADHWLQDVFGSDDRARRAYLRKDCRTAVIRWPEGRPSPNAADFAAVKERLRAAP